MLQFKHVFSFNLTEKDLCNSTSSAGAQIFSRSQEPLILGFVAVKILHCECFFGWFWVRFQRGIYTKLEQKDFLPIPSQCQDIKRICCFEPNRMNNKRKFRWCDLSDKMTSRDVFGLSSGRDCYSDTTFFEKTTMSIKQQCSTIGM